MDYNQKILETMALMLDKKDARTISRLGEKHPALYRLVRHLGHERVMFFMDSGYLGPLSAFIEMSDRELESAGKSLAQTREENAALETQLNQAVRHIREALHLKLESFYRSKAGGYGLKKILETSLLPEKIGHERYAGNEKQALILYIDRYQTSLTKLEVSTHKKILADFIEDSLTSLECKMLIDANGKIEDA